MEHVKLSSRDFPVGELVCSFSLNGWGRPCNIVTLRQKKNDLNFLKKGEKKKWEKKKEPIQRKQLGIDRWVDIFFSFLFFASWFRLFFFQFYYYFLNYYYYCCYYYWFKFEVQRRLAAVNLDFLDDDLLLAALSTRMTTRLGSPAIGDGELLEGI